MKKTPTLQGAVKNILHGFCWIAGDDGIDRFAHRSAFQRTSRKAFAEIQRDDRVEFIPIESVKGPRAIEVRVL